MEPPERGSTPAAYDLKKAAEELRALLGVVEAHGWSPQEIHFQHSHLSLAQIHAALGYYYDHKDELDDQVERSLREASRLQAQAGESPIRKRLREMGKLA